MMHTGKHVLAGIQLHIIVISNVYEYKNPHTSLLKHDQFQNKFVTVYKLHLLCTLR